MIDKQQLDSEISYRMHVLQAYLSKIDYKLRTECGVGLSDIKFGWTDNSINLEDGSRYESKHRNIKINLEGE